jgi:hypothetical protein
MFVESFAPSDLLFLSRSPFFSGGPCGGKTTSLARVFSYLRERGFEVITVPETFTILSSNGLSFDFFTTGGIAKIIQSTVLKIQMTMEDATERVLRARGRPAVMLCDRGTMDGSVYVSKQDFEAVMLENHTDVVQLRDNRYSGIFHLVTAADGAESFYTLENNKVRHESPEQAREADAKTQKAWLGSPHFYVLDNSTDFEGKMERLVDMLVSVWSSPDWWCCFTVASHFLILLLHEQSALPRLWVSLRILKGAQRSSCSEASPMRRGSHQISTTMSLRSRRCTFNKQMVHRVRATTASSDDVPASMDPAVSWEAFIS